MHWKFCEIHRNQAANLSFESRWSKFVGVKINIPEIDWIFIAPTRRLPKETSSSNFGNFSNFETFFYSSSIQDYNTKIIQNMLRLCKTMMQYSLYQISLSSDDITYKTQAKSAINAIKTARIWRGWSKEAFPCTFLAHKALALNTVAPTLELFAVMMYAWSLASNPFMQRWEFILST